MHDQKKMNLPEELIHHVLLQVKNSENSTDFWNCLRTCRQWHRIGLGLFKGLGFAVLATIESEVRRRDVWEETRETRTNLQVVMQPGPPSDAYLFHLRSLTLHVCHQRIVRAPKTAERDDIILSLNRLFNLTRALTTFSLRFSEGWDGPSLDVPAIPGSIVADVVRILPNTVINLELDTAGIELPPCTDIVLNEPNRHTCYEIGKILPRLVNLRLRIGHLCNMLLGLHEYALDCGNVRGCEYCKNGEQRICDLVRGWHMRNMTVWLPWGQSVANNSLAIASRALLNPDRINHATLLFITQTDEFQVTRTTISDPKSDPFWRFSWTLNSNVSVDTQGDVGTFRAEPMNGFSVYMKDKRFIADRSAVSECPECENMRNVSFRTFMLSSPPNRVAATRDTTTSFSYVAEQMVENTSSWIQSSHVGFRFPISEADDASKPFFKTADLWPCLFPNCRVRSRTINHLRGHHIYAHPRFAHFDSRDGVHPCPCPGCPCVGEFGFRDRESFQQHLLEHHRGPCASGSSVLRSYPSN